MSNFKAGKALNQKPTFFLFLIILEEEDIKVKARTWSVFNLLHVAAIVWEILQCNHRMTIPYTWHRYANAAMTKGDLFFTAFVHWCYTLEIIQAKKVKQTNKETKTPTKQKYFLCQYSTRGIMIGNYDYQRKTNNVITCIYAKYFRGQIILFLS